MIKIEQIGTIYSPFNSLENMPIQPKGAKEIEGYIIVDEKYEAGLKDLDGFSHIYLIFYLHQMKQAELLVTPFMDTIKRGVFSTRSPRHPNKLGLSVVELVSVIKNKITIKGVDILNKTPLIDIKPYIHNFDSVDKSKSGWMQKTEKEVIQKRSDNRFV